MEAQQCDMPLKLTKEEEEYLDRLLAEKKQLQLTNGVDLTQKLINAGNLIQVNSLSMQLLGR